MAYNEQLGFDPDDVNSITEWSRRERLRSHQPVEPKPEQQNTQALTQQQWCDWVDQRIRGFVSQYVKEVVDIIGEECAALMRREIAALRSQVKTNHNNLFHRVRGFEDEFDRYVEANKRQKVTIIAPADIHAAIENTIAPLRRELENLRTERKGGEVIDLPALPRRRA